MSDYVTDRIRMIIDDVVIMALNMDTDWETFSRVVQERWHTFEGVGIIAENDPVSCEEPEPMQETLDANL